MEAETDGDGYTVGGSQEVIGGMDIIQMSYHRRSRACYHI